MMYRFAPIWLTRILLAVYLVAMPLDGIAATVAAFVCHSEVAVGAAQGAHDHSQAPATAHDHVPLAEPYAAGHESDDGAYDGHLCCQLVVAAIPSQVSSAGPQEHSPLHPSPGAFHYVIFLEHFQRPPLA